MNWLVADDPEAFANRKATPLFDRATGMYRQVGLEPDLARLAGQRLIAGVIAMVLFPDPLGLSPDDAARLFELEVRIAALLASAPPG